LEDIREAKPLIRKKIFGKAIGFVSYLFILLPAALGVLYVRAFGVSVVKGDAWSIVRLFDM
jgi:hypothetical protein